MIPVHSARIRTDGQIFRSSKKLNSRASLNEADDWFRDDPFQLPEAFAILGDSLIFHCGYCEIAPYYTNITELKIPLCS